MGKIARLFAQGLKEARSGRPVAVGSRDAARAIGFACEFGATRGHRSYNAPIGLYAIEADAVVARARAGLLEAPVKSWADSIGNMDTLDRWHEAVGVRYENDARQVALTTQAGT
jgi:hypothetical protein